MISKIKSIYDLNDSNAKFVFFNTAKDNCVYSWHYDYVSKRNFIIDYDFQNYLYNNSEHNSHHFTNDYHYNVCLPRYAELLNFDLNIDDFEYKHYNGFELSYDYLYPKNNDKQFKVLLYDNGNKIEYTGNYDCLLNFDRETETDKIGDYHLMYIGAHNQSIIYNYGENNGRTLLVIGESQILPEIPIFAYYYKKVLYYDNRHPNSLMYDILYNEDIDDCLVEMWSGRRLNMYELNYVKNVALAVIVKNENKYLKEYVEYYKKLGINHIYIGDNNDSDGEELEEVLYEYLELPNPYITIINIRNRLKYQKLFYDYIYDKFGDKYDWMCFFDADEFLTLKYDHTIQDYLSRDIFYDVDQIHINWLIYDDNDLIEYDNRPVQERFTRISKKVLANKDSEYCMNNGIKSILRCNINKQLSYIYNANTSVHTFTSFDNLTTVLNNGELTDQEWSRNWPNYDLCYIKHYTCKTLGEFLEKKYLRCCADGAIIYNDINGSFFNVNDITDEKIKYLEQHNIKMVA